MFEITPHCCFGVSKSQLFDMCASSSFPGTAKWPHDHPIWDCNIAGRLSPRQGWQDEKCLLKAIDNLYWILNRCADGLHNPYLGFVKAVERAFSTHGIPMLEKVLDRFTVAKIAPKVTALPESLFRREIDKANIDLSSGIYCPMAGFGGIVRAGISWLKDHGLRSDGLVRAADINPNLCDWYGWSCQDVLSKSVSIDMTVCVCPPFGPNTERWPGTPLCMYHGFEKWVQLIYSHVKAPQYAIFGPTKPDKTVVGSCKGLFGRSVQARLYSSDEIDRILKSPLQ